MRLTKLEFVQVIEDFKNVCDQEKTICNTLNVDAEWIPSNWIDRYYQLLRTLCDFTEKDETIEYGTILDYFIYDLDFGRKEKKDTLKIPEEIQKMKTAEDLYDLILKYSVISKIN